MISTFITTGITACLTAFLMVYLAKGNHAEIQQIENGKKTLKVQKTFFIVGVLCIILSLGFSFSPLFLSEEDGIAVLMICISMVLFFGISGAYFILDYKNSQVSYNDKGLVIRDFRKRIYTMEWRNLKRVSHNGLMNQVVVTDGMKKAGFNQYMKGIATLLEDMEQYSNLNTASVKQKINAFKVPGK